MISKDSENKCIRKKSGYPLESDDPLTLLSYNAIANALNNSKLVGNTFVNEKGLYRYSYMLQCYMEV